ncbi:E3.2.1.14 [Mytilus edulis]|uniref:E3.2.1.14 n=1 Tax=Mytilus edulis TaxID=6550 RepID=A0A8S3SY43_MYTED|nr:E3.2.1.14 [Mytilus edulis]
MFSLHSNSDFKRVCYYGTWTNQFQVISGRFNIKDIDPFLCTHAVFAFAKVNTDKLRLERLQPDDDNGLGYPNADGKLYDFTNMKQTNPKLIFINVFAFDYFGSWSKISRFTGSLFSRFSDPAYNTQLSQVKYAKAMGLGGIMFWTYDLDDFTGNHCGQGTFPLLNAIKDAASNTDNLYSTYNTEDSQDMETKAIMSILVLLFVRYSNGSDFKRVCYYTTWSNQLQVTSGRFYIKDIDPFLCTHAVFAFAKVNTDKLRLERLQVDDDNGLGYPKAGGKLYDFTNMKRTNPKLVTLLSIGGATSSEALHNVAETLERRKTFAQNCRIYLRDRNFDGFDIDWEYPRAFKDKFTELLKAMRLEFENDQNKEQVKIGTFYSRGCRKPNIDESYNVTEIVKYVDFINVMAYDYFGTWSKVSGFTGSLFSRLSDPTYSSKLSQLCDKRLSGIWDDEQKYTYAYSVHDETDSNMSNTNKFLFYRYVDFINVMAYDYFGTWSKVSGFTGSLFSRLSDPTYSPELSQLCDKRLSGTWDDEQKYTYAYSGNQWFAYNTKRSMIEKVNTYF